MNEFASSEVTKVVNISEAVQIPLYLVICVVPYPWLINLTSEVRFFLIFWYLIALKINNNHCGETRDSLLSPDFPQSLSVEKDADSWVVQLGIMIVGISCGDFKIVFLWNRPRPLVSLRSGRNNCVKFFCEFRLSHYLCCRRIFACKRVCMHACVCVYVCMFAGLTTMRPTVVGDNGRRGTISDRMERVPGSTPALSDKAADMSTLLYSIFVITLTRGLVDFFRFEGKQSRRHRLKQHCRLDFAREPRHKQTLLLSLVRNFQLTSRKEIIRLSSVGLFLDLPVD